MESFPHDSNSSQVRKEICLIDNTDQTTVWESENIHFWYVCSLCKDFSDGTINFNHVTLDLHLKNFNSAHNFLTIRHRALIFGMSVPYIKTFLVVT